ncbi:MAG: tetratricopeptide repeat protein [Vicinamibacterales bacterium]|nr:tetratricopeptide repeat protein [Vicinamibacterales bacterium]
MALAGTLTSLRRPSALQLPAYLTLLLFSLSFLPRVRDGGGLIWSFWGACAGLLVWQVAMRTAAARQQRSLTFEFTLQKNHYLQLLAHIGVYLYWGWYWPEVANHAWLIVAQIVFAYAFDMLLAWSRRDSWRLGFGPFPIILSTNLFLWFRDDWFFLQFLMVALGFIGKELFTWTKDGRRTHIFNPSGFSLSVFSIVLIALGQTELTWGQEIAQTLRYPEHMYLVIFLLGLFVQYFFAVTLMTLSAAAALYVLGAVYSGVTGVYFFVDTSIPIAVFLGLHLLITDPSTSPRTALGRVLFGALYGASVFALYALFVPLGVPAFYDKLLCVPVLNLSVRMLDRIARAAHAEMLGFDKLWPSFSLRQLNFGSMAVWTLLFVGLLNTNMVGARHEGANPAFWEEACSEGLRHGCRKLLVRQSNNCAEGFAWSCNELGILLAEGTLVAGDSSGAAASFARACDLGLAAGCTNADALASGALGFTRASTSFAYAWAYQDTPPLQEACDTGDGEGCYLLASAYREGRGVARDEAMARELFLRSCDLGWPTGCSALAEVYLRGEGVAVDFGLAAGGFDQACTAGEAMSCLRLGLMYRAGEGIAPDETRSRALIAQACDMGLPTACEMLAELR